jgi:hypothetical protein
MNIIIDDLAKYIINFLTPDQLMNWIYINKYFNNIVINTKLYSEWKKINIITRDYNKDRGKINKKGGTTFFIMACNKGYFDICRYLYNTYSSDNDNFQLHFNITDVRPAFNISCVRGYINIAKWLLQITFQKKDIPTWYKNNEFIDSDKTCQYRINLHKINMIKLFDNVDDKGHTDVIEWLIDICQKENIQYRFPVLNCDYLFSDSE